LAENVGVERAAVAFADEAPDDDTMSHVVGIEHVRATPMGVG
jgi:hypothetical protein